jgi:peptide/nickel transport system ATP-binding protein
VAQAADRVLVMYAGKIAEEAPVHEIFANPRHPYTIGLLNSIPRIDPHGHKKRYLDSIEGTVPAPGMLPPGCSFYDRCHFRSDVCRAAAPEEIWINSEHRVACYREQQ